MKKQFVPFNSCHMHVSGPLENVGKIKVTDLYIHSREQITGVLAWEANQTRPMECVMGKFTSGVQCCEVVSVFKTASHTASFFF